jgi:hypothetical protein
MKREAGEERRRETVRSQRLALCRSWLPAARTTPERLFLLP